MGGSRDGGGRLTCLWRGGQQRCWSSARLSLIFIPSFLHPSATLLFWLRPLILLFPKPKVQQRCPAAPVVPEAAHRALGVLPQAGRQRARLPHFTAVLLLLLVIAEAAVSAGGVLEPLKLCRRSSESHAHKAGWRVSSSEEAVEQGNVGVARAGLLHILCNVLQGLEVHLLFRDPGGGGNTAFTENI